MATAAFEDIRARVGDEIGCSAWIAVEQRHIDLFADVTGDRQFIHVDPDAAARTPFGGTVAHGFLTLSLLSQMAAGVMVHPLPVRMAVNYGLDRVRFIAPVRAGKRVRGRFTLTGAEEKKPGQWQLVHRVLVEIESEDKPALTADWITLIVT